MAKRKAAKKKAVKKSKAKKSARSPAASKKTAKRAKKKAATATTWRERFERSGFAQSLAEEGGLVYGAPAAPQEIAAVAQRLHVSFPPEFCELYREFNGVRLPGDPETWWLVPLEQIQPRTLQLRESWFDDAESAALAPRMVVFGHWDNGDVFGCLADAEGTISSMGIWQYQHEAGLLEPWPTSLEDMLSQ